jgi:hypothetical protein
VKLKLSRRNFLKFASAAVATAALPEAPVAKEFASNVIKFESAVQGPSTMLWIGLYVGPPSTGGGPAKEATYTNYQRIPVMRKATDWMVGNGEATNVKTIAFPSPGEGSSERVYGAFIADSAGNHLYSAPFVQPLTVSQGVQPYFAPGNLTITEEGMEEC